MYIECLTNNPFMRHYSAQKDILIADMAAVVCKDVGCMVNYCSLLKMSLPMEWEESSDCVDEYKVFNDCMRDEQRRWNWLPQAQRAEIVKYDYIQKRIADRRFQTKFAIDKELKIDTITIEPQEEPFIK